MLSENQIKRLLKQSENSNISSHDENLQGWIQALRIVLEEDTYPIRKDPIDGK
jgi:hypothetical protein